jgi:hypothetical protein
VKDFYIHRSDLAEPVKLNELGEALDRMEKGVMKSLAERGIDGLEALAEAAQKDRDNDLFTLNIAAGNVIWSIYDLEQKLEENALTPEQAVAEGINLGQVHQTFMLMTFMPHISAGLGSMEGGKRGAKATNSQRNLPTREAALAVYKSVRNAHPEEAETPVKKRAAKQLGIGLTKLYELLRD